MSLRLVRKLPGASDITRNDKNVIPIISGIMLSRRFIRNLAIAWAARDYSGALAAFEPSIAARHGKVSVGDLSLLLYLLGKSGRTDDARTLVATLDSKNNRDVGVFVDWFQSRFDAQASLTPTSAPR